MTPDLDEIERRALAATPGEWTDRQDRTVAAEGVPIIRCYAWRNTADNAAHIAGMSPAVTLALVARIRELEGALKESDQLVELEQVFRNPGERIGHENRERVRHLLTTKLGITNVEISRELNLNPIAVGKHVARIRKEWIDQ